MLFHEYSFLFVFLPITLAVYYALPFGRRNAWIFLASLVFYAESSWRFLPVLMLSICADYFIGGRIVASTNPRTKKLWLLCSVSTNLGLLSYFKYSAFIVNNLRSLLQIPQLQSESLKIADMFFSSMGEALLPAGISFYVFQGMSYCIDIYRGQAPRAKNFVSFGAFIALFPQLISGPIVRYKFIAGQLQHREHNTQRFASGVQLFMVGLAKKLLLADTLASLAQPIFSSGSPGFLDAWASMLLYSGQIYFDFSGYSDMAIGLGRLLGFEFPFNFNSPYQASSFSDFWRRWHMTLSQWLRDNLYVPLGGNRLGARRTYANLMLTMLLGGLWHGASWNFVIWGGLHGGYLSLERFLGAQNPVLLLPPWAKRLVIFFFVLLAWVFFRLETFAESSRWIAAMLFGSSGLGAVTPFQLAGVSAVVVLCSWPKNSNQLDATVTLPRTLAIGALFVTSLFVGYGRGFTPFLYFRF